jgi:hypothetical protein
MVKWMVVLQDMVVKGALMVPRLCRVQWAIPDRRIVYTNPLWVPSYRYKPLRLNLVRIVTASAAANMGDPSTRTITGECAA